MSAKVGNNSTCEAVIPLGSEAVSNRCEARRGSRRRTLKTLYYRIPPSWRRLLDPLVRCYRLWDEIRPRFWIGDSQPRDDGLSISILCVAGTWERSFLFDQILGRQRRERCVGRAWLWNAAKVWARKGPHCCAILVYVRPGFRRFLGSQKWLHIPAWVVGEVELPLSPQVLATGNVKEDLRKIRKSALGYTVTRDLQQFEDFYANMYVPHARRFYGDGARIWPRGLLLKHLDHGEILLVTRQGQPVAGNLISYAEAEPLLVVSGVRDGDRRALRDGVGGAIYHLSFRHLTEQGFTRVGLGKSRAFLRDGVLRYKKKLGMKLVGTSEGYFYLRVPHDTEASRAFLKDNPLILDDNGGLHGVVFVETNAGSLSEAQWAELDKEFSCQGLSCLWIVPLNSPDRPPRVPASWVSRISVRGASEVLGSPWGAAAFGECMGGCR